MDLMLNVNNISFYISSSGKQCPKYAERGIQNTHKS